MRDKGGEGPFDPVTEADRAAEAAMRAVLARLRPGDAVLGEEAGAAPPSRRRPPGWPGPWDPIDGTRAYIFGAPTWGTLIAVGPEGGPPVFGLIDQPFTGERFEGGFGAATLAHRGEVRRIATRARRVLGEATLLSTFPEIGTAAERAGFEALARRCRLTRYGLDCYGYALFAMGQVDLVVEAGLSPWDVAAPIALIEAAGGMVTDWRGRPAHRGGRVLAASCTAIHAAALEVLAGVPGG